MGDGDLWFLKSCRRHNCWLGICHKSLLGKVVGILLFILSSLLSHLTSHHVSSISSPLSSNKRNQMMTIHLNGHDSLTSRHRPARCILCLKKRKKSYLFSGHYDIESPLLKAASASLKDRYCQFACSSFNVSNIFSSSA